MGATFDWKVYGLVLRFGAVFYFDEVNTMKLGVSSYSFSKYMKQTGADLFEVACLARGLGFDAIEFTELKVDDPLSYAAALRRHCESLGLEVTAYAVGMNLLKGDAEENVAKLCLCADVAAALGAHVMRHDVCSALPEGVSWEEGIDRMVPLIRRVTAYAKTLGVRTCSENHGYIYQDSARVKRLIDAVDDPNYRWLLDIGNFLCADEDPRSAVEVALPYVVHVHLKDFLYRKVDGEGPLPTGFFKTRNNNLLRGTALGHGDVPVFACVKRLRDAGYDGALSLEFEGAEENLPALRMGIAYMKALTV